MKWVTVGVAIVVVVVVAGVYVKIHDSHSNVSAVDQLLKHAPSSDVSGLTSFLKQHPDVRIPNSLPFSVTLASETNGGGPEGRGFTFFFVNKQNNRVLTETVVIQHKITVASPDRKVKLADGIIAAFSQNQNATMLSWNKDGDAYQISSIVEHGSSVLSPSQLLSIANGMQ